MRILIALGALTAWATAAAQAPDHVCHYRHSDDAAPREHSLDIERVKVEAAFDPNAGRVNGKVTHYFKVLQNRVDTLFFDGPGIEILSVQITGRDVKFKTVPEGVVVYPNGPLNWDQKDSIVFTYRAFPKKGIYFTGWDDPKGVKRKQIWTQGQGIDHRHWIPCYDDMNDKVVTETVTTFDGRYKVLSNGTLKSVKDNPDGTKTWHYAMSKPHSLYLLMLAIGEYNVKSFTTKRGMPVHLWYYPDHEDRFDNIYKYSLESIEFMEEHTMIPFPWESYAQVPVQDYIYGAMENTTATIFGDFFCVDKRDFIDRNYINVNVHELTHQWFGDLITGRSAKEIWLQESFATFYPKLFARKIWGEDKYQHSRRGEQNAALDAGKKDDFPIRSTKAGTSRWYPKGSAVLDMLMYVYGEEEYRRVIYHYLKKHAYKNVETIDLEHAFQDTLGKTPEWFFDQWIYRGGEPHYHASHQPVYKNGEAFTEITVKQIHPRYDLVGLFKMPIVFEVYYDGGGTQRVRQWVEKETEKILVPNPGGKKVEFVLFDPGSYIIKKLTFPRSFDELKAQALKAPNMIDRYDALYAMRDFPIETRRATLVKAFYQEKFHYTKGEIVAQLIDDGAPESIEVIQNAVFDSDPEVRRAVIANTKDIRLLLLPYYERLLADSSYSIVAEALDKLARQYPKNLKRYLALTQNDVGEAQRVKIKWLEVAYAYGGDKAALRRLVEYASATYEFRTRQNAMQSLQRINYLDDKATAHMTHALLSANSRLHAVAKEVLKHFYAQHEGRAVIERHFKSLNPSSEQKQTLKLITG